MKKLTVKQEKFCELYVTLGNGSEAYRQAYDVKEGTTSKSVNEQASVLFGNLNIFSRIEELRESAKEKHGIDRAYILKGYFEIISDADYTFNLGKNNELSKEDRQAFFRIMQQTKNTDKLRALESISKMLGLNEPETFNININTFKTSWG